MLRNAVQSLLPLASTSGAAQMLQRNTMLALARTYATGAGSSVVEIQKDEEFAKVVKGHKGLAVVDFTAKWCGPCKVIAPVYEQLAQQNPTVKFTKVDVDNPEVLTTVAGHEVSGVPMFVFYKGGEKVASFTGAQRDKLIATINQHK